MLNVGRYSDFASLTAPIDDAVAGRKSQDSISWTDALHEAFSRAQKALFDTRTIVLPRSDDQLWIITDGTVRKPGIGATLYVMRNEKLSVAGLRRQWNQVDLLSSAVSNCGALRLHGSPARLRLYPLSWPSNISAHTSFSLGVKHVSSLIAAYVFNHLKSSVEVTSL